MFPRLSLLALTLVLAATNLRAAQTRDELQFALNAALLSGDRKAFARSFNFAGTDAATQQSFVKIIDQIFGWPTHEVFVTERSEHGEAKIVQNGRPYRLNGDWIFQVHIYLSKKTNKGFVFPAGMVGGQCMVLIAVPAKS